MSSLNQNVITEMSVLDLETIDLHKLTSNRKEFNDFVYTPLSTALDELERRKNDPRIAKIVLEFLDGDIPPPLQESPKLVLLRYLLTPNYEILRFLHVTHGVPNINPLLCEYSGDKFVPSNPLKRFLGKLTFYSGRDRNGALQGTRLSVIDFENAENQKLNNILTLWKESLKEFHHDLFFKTYKHITVDQTYDISSWYAKHGPTAKNFYAPLLSLFITHGILFENLIIQDKDESSFVREIFLPSFIKVFKLTGLKPLIVPFEPTDVEGDKFWLSYPPEVKQLVQEKYFANITNK